MTQSREQLLVKTFVTLADSLVAGYDIIDLLQTLVDRAIDLFDAAAAGIILGHDAEHLEVIVSTSENSRLVGLMQLRAGEGPCIEAITSGAVVSVEDATEMHERWPVFATAAEGSGFVSVHAIPLRLRGQIIGSLNLFRDHEGALNKTDATSAQALADVATISILQERSIRDSSIVHDQLQRALDTRIVIEQAKGVLSHTHGVDMEAAFRLIRDHSRFTGSLLSEVAAGIVNGTVRVKESDRRKG